MNAPGLTRKTYSMGCNHCAARYLENGGADVSAWAHYGVDPRKATQLRTMGELIDPELKRKGKR